MSYDLNQLSQAAQKGEGPRQALSTLWPLLASERDKLVLSFGAIILNSVLTLIVPFGIGYAIDHFVRAGRYSEVLWMAAGLLGLYLVGLLVSYRQMMLMGSVGQSLLYKLRNLIFAKLQDLPLAFFSQNKAGDLISRINSDTEKLHQFLAESLTRFMGNLFIMVGAGIFVMVLDWRLGLCAILPAFLLLGFSRLISPWVKARNAESLRAAGGLSAEVQESLAHFKVIVAFNRRDYFRTRFETANASNYSAALRAGVASNLFTPVYELMYHLAQLGVLAYGIWLISRGQLTIGLLIAFLTYVSRFYDPLRQIAMLWSAFQLALASWERISVMLALENNLAIQQDYAVSDPDAPLLRFEDVGFHYPEGPPILSGASFALERGKTYAFVGPTGGGKSTTASLMARLYDPSQGRITLMGRDLRSYSPAERARHIGFILQEPFLLSGSVADNLSYANPALAGLSPEALGEKLEQAGLGKLLSRFDQGLATPVSNEALSLGQKQLVAFMRAILRAPDLLILDEATANIDTITEQLLEEILQQLPDTTTRVIIAHRLNTIEAADEIFFVNSGAITPAGSLEHAVDMLMKQELKS